VWLWAPVITYLVAIFVVSSMPQPPEMPGGVGDKSLHGLAYAVLGVLLVRALSGGDWARVTGRVVFVAIVLATAYGITDELHQAFVPGRSPDPRDVVADAVGATIGALGYYAIARVRGRGRGR
jgi:VanZ family protein